jgi:hypothetical protein
MMMLRSFKDLYEVNSQQAYNRNGMIDAIPIIAYHDIDYDKAVDSTDINLFDQEMKYLHDNGFKVVPMSDIGYNETTKYLFLKQYCSYRIQSFSI